MSKLIEEWRPVAGYEGLYEVSDWGNVRSLDRLVLSKAGSYRKAPSVLLSQDIDKDGYCRVGLHFNGKTKQKGVHCLVAEAFIPNPDKKEQVGHLKKLSDGTEDKTANEAWNLAWMTCTENNNYGTRNERISETKKERHCKGKETCQYTLDGELLKIWPATMEIERECGFDKASISRCCLGKQETAYGFKWKYNS